MLVSRFRPARPASIPAQLRQSIPRPPVHGTGIAFVLAPVWSLIFCEVNSGQLSLGEVTMRVSHLALTVALLVGWVPAARARRAMPARPDLKVPKAMRVRLARRGRPGLQVRRVKKDLPGQPVRVSGSSDRTACRGARCNARTTRSLSPLTVARRVIRLNSPVKEALHAVRCQVRRIRPWSRFALVRRSKKARRRGSVFFARLNSRMPSRR